MAMSEAELNLLFPKSLCLEFLFSLLIGDDDLARLAILSSNTHCNRDLSAFVKTNIELPHFCGGSEELSESHARLLLTQVSRSLESSSLNGLNTGAGAQIIQQFSRRWTREVVVVHDDLRKAGRSADDLGCQISQALNHCLVDMFHH